jgi:hypothetical protein
MDIEILNDINWHTEDTEWQTTNQS